MLFSRPVCGPTPIEPGPSPFRTRDASLTEKLIEVIELRVRTDRTGPNCRYWLCKGWGGWAGNVLFLAGQLGNL